MRSNKIRTIILAAVAVLAIAAVAAPSAALAKKKNKKQSITLVVNGGDFSGQIKAKKAPQCISEREVIVYKLAGNSPSPATDEEGPSDTSDELGRWNTGNNGAYDGKYYAHAPATLGCKALTSKIGVVTGRGTPEEEL